MIQNTTNRRLIAERQSGFVLPVLIIVMIVVVILFLAISNVATQNVVLSNQEIAKTNTQMTADAGLDSAIVNLTGDSDWTGDTSEVTMLNTSSLRTTYQAAISDGSSDTKKIVTVTARSYTPATSTTASFTRKYQMDVEAVTSGTGPSSVVSGIGGLILSNNSKISGGDVLVNGKITMSNNSQIGLQTNPLNVRVAHQSCPNPPNSTYPQVCGAGSGEPITLGSNSKIYANVQATNQVTGTNMSNPGLIPNSTFAPVALPTYDRAAHKAAVVSTYASTDSTVACGNNQSKTWPANVKITGNLTLGNNCTVTLLGNIWLTGNLNFGNNAKIVVSNSVGATRPVFMIDGQSGLIFGNNSSIQANNVNTGIEVISFWWNTNTATNGNFNCGGIADLFDCTNVTGLALSSSQNVTTINLSNNGSAPYTVLRTMWTKVTISNNAALGAVQGQTIQLGNNAVINFSSSVPGSDNQVTTWVKRGYMRVFN